MACGKHRRVARRSDAGRARIVPGDPFHRCRLLVADACAVRFQMRADRIGESMDVDRGAFERHDRAQGSRQGSPQRDGHAVPCQLGGVKFARVSVELDARARRPDVAKSQKGGSTAITAAPGQISGLVHAESRKRRRDPSWPVRSGLALRESSALPEGDLTNAADQVCLWNRCIRFGHSEIRHVVRERLILQSRTFLLAGGEVATSVSSISEPMSSMDPGAIPL